MCPNGSPRKALSPIEARDAHLYNDSEAADKLFRDAIKEKREAKARGDMALANEIETRIQELDKARIRCIRNVFLESASSLLNQL